MSRAALSLCFLVLCLSCHKADDPPISNYTFHNTTGKALTFDIYREAADYSTAQNRYAQYKIDPGSAVTIPLEGIRTWYFDWYSADYLYNNWMTGSTANASDIPPTPKYAYPVANVDDQVDITHQGQDYSRSILLHDSGTVAAWKAFKNYYSSTTTPVPFITVTLHKDFTGEYVHDDAGTRVTEPVTFSVRGRSYNFPNISVSLYKVSDGQSIGSLSYSQNQGLGKDTLYGTFNSVNSYFMNRQ